MICGISRDVTDRKQMNQALEESEEKFRVLAETISAGVAIYQGENFVDVNKAFERLTGYSSEELLHMKFWDIGYEDYKLLIKERGLARQRGQAEPLQYECKLITKSGNIKYVEFNAGYIVFKGKPGGVITCFDITERKQAEETVYSSEEKFRQIAESVNLVYFLVSPECDRMFYINPAYERITGLDLKEVYKNPLVWLKLLPHDDRLKVLSIVENLNSGVVSNPGEIELRFQRPDGMMGWMIFRLFPVRDREGKLQRIVGIVEDVTERNQAEYALRESEANLKKAQQIAHFGSWKLYIETKNISLSDELYRILGIEPAQVARDNEISYDKFLEYIRSEERALFTVNMETAIRSQGGNSFDVRIIRKDGEERIVHVDQEVVFSNGGQPLLLYGICQDVTERKRIEEEREELIRQLRESNEQLSMIMHVTDNSATTQSVDDILNTTLNRLVRDMNADVCAILLKDNERVYVQASRVEKLARARASFPIGNGFESNIIGSVKPLFLEDTQLESGTINQVLKEIGVRSVIGVPIRHRNDTIGVLYVEWLQPHVFKKQEQDVLQIIADRCGASIMMQTFMKRPKNFIEKTYINRNKYF